MLSQRKAVKEMEHEVAEALGGRRTPFSGSGFVKGDGRVLGTQTGDTEPPGGTGGYRIECKWTGRPTFRLTHRDWLDLCISAASAHESPVFVVRLLAKDRVYSQTYAVIRKARADTLKIRPKSKDNEPHKSYTIQSGAGSTCFSLLEKSGEYAELALVAFEDLVDALKKAKR